MTSRNFKIFFAFFLLMFSKSNLAQNYTDSLNFYYKKKDYQKALIFGEKLELNSGIIKNKLNLIAIKSNNGVMYHSIGEFKLASKKFDEALLLAKDENRITNLEIAIVKKQASRNLKELRDFAKAKKLVNEALDFYKSNENENQADYADALRVLGDIYKTEGKIEKAIPIIKESSKIFKEVFGENEYYSYSIGSLGDCYFLIEDYNNAEFYYSKSIEIQKKLKSTSSDYALSIAALAKIYIVKKQYELAEDLLFQADEILRNEEEYSIKHLTILDELGNIYTEIKKYDDAETLFKLSILLKEKQYGKNHSNVLAIKNNLALVYFKMNKLEAAKEIFLEIVNSKSVANIDEYNIINNLALVYSDLKEYNEAENYYLKALKKVENSNLKESSKHIKLLANIVLFYNKTNKNNYANKYVLKEIHLIKKQILKLNEFFTEYDLVNYIERDYESIYFPFTFLQSHPTQYPEINTACFENELLIKNLSLRNQQRIKTTIEKSGDVVVKEKYHQFIENKRQITKLDELPISERTNTYDQLKTETENLEKELTRLSSTFADAKKSLSINWKQIQEKLKPNEVIIDIVSYNYFNKKWTDSIIYAAFVIKKDSKFPKYITLFEQKQLATLLERNNNEADTIQTKILNKQYSDKTIGNLFYQPLEQELKGCKTIYLAPSGLTHQINFKALPINDNQTFGEQFDIKLVGSTASILDYKPTSFHENKNLELILYGGIDYNKKSNENQTDENQNSFNALATRSGILEFSYLKGTNIEVEKINTEAKKFNFNTIVKTEKNATEESIKQLDGKTAPFVLHLATHGFFFENIKQEKQDDFILMEENTKRKIYKSSEDPMMRSGLILAGANKFWGKIKEETTTEDGILTAKEISNLDLSACQLVVLSACETGLGQVNGSEGVFGLQRAFKMAGVKNIIMSLWKVPDSQTAELFELFYSECFSGKSIQEAFQSTQSKMKAKYSPYYWAGFILLE